MKDKLKITHLLIRLISLLCWASVLLLIIFNPFEWTLFTVTGSHKVLVLILASVEVLCKLTDMISDAANSRADIDWEWHDRKRTFLGLPLSFTRYRLSKEKIVVRLGFFNTREEETKLYRITDISITRSFGQKLLGLGTLTLHSSDKSDPTLMLKSIKNSEKVKNLISKLVEDERDRKRVTGREIIDGHHDPDCDCECGAEEM